MNDTPNGKKMPVLASQLRKVLEWLSRRIAELLNIPLWLLSFLIPKSDQIWVFGSWFSEKYSDNPKWLYEYVTKHVPEVRAIWLSRNKDVIHALRQRGMEAYLTYSLRGYWYSARAKVGVVCQGILDINRFVKPPVLINTWHGTPIKKVGEEFRLFRAQQQHGGRLRDLANKISMPWFRLFPFSDSINPEKYYSLYTAGSQAEAELLKKSFGNVNVKVTGQPRNDVLCGSFDDQLAKQSTKKQVLYLPTHRFEGRQRIVPYIVKGINEIDSLLGDLNAHMIIKLHFVHRHENADLASALKDFTNISVLDDETTEDIYPLLRSTDILITDYSSVYVDYLLTTRPIIFFPFDLDDYMARERPFNFDYMSITPGPKCWDWHGVALWIKSFCEDPTPYLEERLKLKELFHEFDDGRNCERVVAAIKELLLGLKDHNTEFACETRVRTDQH